MPQACAQLTSPGLQPPPLLLLLLQLLLVEAATQHMWEQPGKVDEVGGTAGAATIMQHSNQRVAALRADDKALYSLLCWLGMGHQVAVSSAHLRAVAVSRSLTFFCSAWLNSHCSTR